MAELDEARLDTIRRDPDFVRLTASRSRFGWLIALSMMAIYFGFILLIAFNKELLAARFGDGVMTLGIPIGLGVILSTLVLTGIYVARANSAYDELSERIKAKAGAR
jgi:uncharacterized membrane protein (DUF485 family)